MSRSIRLGLTSQCRRLKHLGSKSYGLLSRAKSWGSSCSLCSPCSNAHAACAVATSSCISDVPSQWEGQNFDPHCSRIFQPILMKFKNQERHPGYNPTCKMWLMWEDGKRVCLGRAFSVTFCLLSILFCILAHAYRSHQKTDHDRLWLRTRVSA